MLQQIRDKCNHLICLADTQTGKIIAKYKKYCVDVQLPVGGEITLQREGTKTVIRRINDMCFDVLRQ